MLGAKMQVSKNRHHGDLSPGNCAPLLYVIKHLEISLLANNSTSNP